MRTFTIRTLWREGQPFAHIPDSQLSDFDTEEIAEWRFDYVPVPEGGRETLMGYARETLGKWGTKGHGEQEALALYFGWEVFRTCLRSWNLVDLEDVPIPLTTENILRCSVPIVLAACAKMLAGADERKYPGPRLVLITP